jgi:hypothetical protein
MTLIRNSILGLSLLCAFPFIEAKPASTVAHQKMEFLLTITLKQASFKQVQGNQYALIVPKDKVDQILIFSDRPNKVAFSVNPDEFSKLVHIGPEVYKNDPPNVSLVFDKNQMKTAAFAIQGYQMGSDSVTYQLKLLGNHTKLLPSYQGQMVLFVDGCDFFNWLTGWEQSGASDSSIDDDDGWLGGIIEAE